MAAEDYVVIRIGGGASPEILGGLEGAASEADLSVVKSPARSEIEEIKKDPEVLGMAPVMPVALVAPFENGDSPAENGNATWGVQVVGAIESPFDGAGVAIAVLDTGIDASHEAFRGKTLVQRDFTGEGDGDGNGHGTHCAGTIFGSEVGGQRIGVAPGVRKAFIGKVLNRRGSGSTEQLLDGVLWAARSGANVISMSIGLDFPGLVKRLVDSGLEIEPATSKALAAYRENVRLFDKLAELLRAQSAMLSKTMIVAAAGNESRRPTFEIATAPPAAADGIVSVAAIGRSSDTLTDLRVAAFSNTGADVAAPGVGVVSAKVGGGLRALDGTSMATPHVAGIAALWIQKVQERNPSFKISEVQGRLVGQATSSLIAADEDPSDLGAGIVQAPRS